MAAGSALACNRNEPTNAKPQIGDSQAPAPVTAPVPAQTDSLTTLLARLESTLAPLVARRDAKATELRRDSGTARADSAFLRFRASLVGSVRAAMQAFNDSSLQFFVWPEYYRHLRAPADSIDHERADSVIRYLRSRGIWTWLGELGAHFRMSERVLLTSWGPFLTQPTQEYLRLLALKQTRPTGADGSFMISWDELADRVASTDRFLAMYPDALVRDSVGARQLNYLRWYVLGSSTSNVFRRGSRTPAREVRSSYERYAALHGSIATGQLIREYLDVLRANDYRYNARVVEFLRQKSGLAAHHLPRPREQP